MTRSAFLKQSMLSELARGRRAPAQTQARHVIIATDLKHVFQCDGWASNPPRVDNSPYKST